MNLNGFASGLTRMVSPATSATVQRSTGYTTATDGSQSPTYDAPETILIDVQTLSARELQHIDNIGIQSITRGVWADGELKGLDRDSNTGGDILTFDGADWLVTQVIETWNGSWCHVAVTKQRSA